MEKLKDIEKLRTEYNSLILKNTKLKEKNAEMEAKVKKDFLDPAREELKKHQAEVEADLAVKKEKQETELKEKESALVEGENKLIQDKKEFAEDKKEVKAIESNNLIEYKALDKKEKEIEDLVVKQKERTDVLAGKEKERIDFKKEVKEFANTKLSIERQKITNEKTLKELDEIRIAIEDALKDIKQREANMASEQLNLAGAVKYFEKKFGIEALKGLGLMGKLKEQKVKQAGEKKKFEEWKKKDEEINQLITNTRKFVSEQKKKK